MQELTHFIDGAMTKGTSGRFSDVFNPATGEVQAKLPIATAAETNDVVERAAKAQVAWGATNPQRRARVMMKPSSACCIVTWTSWPRRCPASTARPSRTPSGDRAARARG